MRVPNPQPKETTTMMKTLVRRQRNIFHENVIRVGAGFAAKERPHVAATLSTLGPHLGKWDSRDVNVVVSLQDRRGKEQRVILRTSLPGLPPLVAVAKNPDITRALCDAKRELIRQIEHCKSARKPMRNRRLSATIRHNLRATRTAELAT
jgi:ribosome-associated translation inhibitor RaiA